MPLITKKPRRIAGKDCEVHIYYSSTRGFYVHKGLPTNMGDFIPNLDGRISGEETEALLETALNSVIREYEAKIKTNRLVLVINCTLGRETRELMGWDHRTNQDHPLSSTYERSVKGHGFDMEFCICREFSTGEAKDYRQRDSDDNHGRILRNNTFFRPSKQSIVIEYTPERAEFLQRMAEGAKRIGEGLAEFFTQDEAKMIERVESAALGASNLLLGPATSAPSL